ncbi:hypothetical protein BDR26DRAFT_873853 [Obelidium mucronatum]|nr:hypothetical protein BDR26DRAFT_873853 [Obelidium mucronatum]
MEVQEATNNLSLNSIENDTSMIKQTILPAFTDDNSVELSFINSLVPLRLSEGENIPDSSVVEEFGVDESALDVILDGSSEPLKEHEQGFPTEESESLNPDHGIESILNQMSEIEIGDVLSTGVSSSPLAEAVKTGFRDPNADNATSCSSPLDPAELNDDGGSLDSSKISGGDEGRLESYGMKDEGECGTHAVVGSINFDLLPKIELDFENDWFQFPTQHSALKNSENLVPPIEDSLLQESAYFAKCLNLGDVETQLETNNKPTLELDKPVYQKEVKPLGTFHFGSSSSTLENDSIGGGLNELSSPPIDFGADKTSEFFMEESPSLEIDSQNNSFADISDILPQIRDEQSKSLDLILSEELGIVLPEDSDITPPKRSSSRTNGFGQLWRSGSLSSVFSGSSLSGLWRKKKKPEETVTKKKKTVRWGLARQGDLEQTKLFHPEAPVVVESTGDVGRENGILLFQLDCVDQVIVPDNQPVTLNMTLTYNGKSTFTIPPITINHAAPTTPISFECLFNLPSKHSMCPPPQLDMTLRVSPIIPLSTELKTADKRKQLKPQVSHQSRSIALPQIFRPRSSMISVPTSLDKKKNTLPLGGVSTRGTLISNVREFAEWSESGGGDKDGVDGHTSGAPIVAEKTWCVDFGEQNGVKMRFLVRGVGIIKSIMTPGIVFPETFSEAAYAIEVKELHETVQLRGHLSQMGGGLTSWRRRYFELVGCHLYAYHEDTRQLMMTIDLSLVQKIRCSGVAATLCPRSERYVASAYTSQDSVELEDEPSTESQANRMILSNLEVRENSKRRQSLKAASTSNDPAVCCDFANLFEIEMKDGEVIEFSTLGEAFAEEPRVEDGESCPNNPGASGPWWKLNTFGSSEADTSCSELEFLSGFLDPGADLDDVFEDIEIQPCGGKKRNKNGLVQKEFDDAILVDSSSPVAKRWLNALTTAAVNIGDEIVPDWLK